MLLYKREDGCCWICRQNGSLTREHKFKASGLREQHGDTTYYVVGGSFAGQFRIAQSVTSNFLKFKPSICNRCNSNITQNADRAFDTFREMVEELGGDDAAIVKVWQSKEFSVGTQSYLNLFRYFTKLLGCHLSDCDYPIPLRFSRFVSGQSDRNSVWLNAHVHNDQLASTLNISGFVAQGGFVITSKKPNFSPVAIYSSVSFGRIQFAFHYRWTTIEKFILYRKFPHFVQECKQASLTALDNEMTDQELSKVGLHRYPTST